MKITNATILSLALAALGALQAHAQLAQSTFDSGSDGWVSIFRQYPFVGGGSGPFSNHVFTGVNTTLAYQATGGNPGGCIQASDSNLGDWYWRAPAKFLGANFRAYGATLSFDLWSGLQGGAVTLADHDIILSGGGVTLYGNFLILTQAQTWQHFSIPLHESAGWSELVSGLPATSNQMMTVLSSLTVLDIRGEFGGSVPDTGRIDNIVLGPSIPSQATLGIQFYPSVTITGTVAARYRLEYAEEVDTNLWATLAEFVLPYSPYSFCDLTATNRSRRFYRAFSVPPARPP